MMEKAILTVIVFTYNHKDSISKCLDNIVNQNTNYNYEVHICDDASTDGTSNICREYGEKYPDKIKLFIQPENTYKRPYRQNQFYKAIARVDTKYWCYIDGDDYWCDDNFIQVAIDSLENNPSCATFCSNFIMECKDSRNKGINEVFKTGIYKDREITWGHPSSRIHRTFKEFAESCRLLDVQCFYYYLFKGDVYYDSRVMSVYNYNELGVWSKLSKKMQKNLSRITPFRMCQIYNFEHEKFWLSLTQKQDKKIIKFLKHFFDKKTAWYIWYILTIVPTFGWESLDKEWRYSTSNYYNNIVLREGSRQ